MTTTDRSTPIPTAEATRPEEGVVLVLVAILSVGLLGLAGVVIDLGLVRRAQAEMQVATDSAAVEAMRFRDVDTPDADLSRRLAARAAIARAFDTPPDTASGSTSGTPSFGAGPDLGRTDPIGRFGGLVKVGLEEDGDVALDLVPELNTGNFQNGDLVAGRFDPIQPGLEATDYTRTDFLPVPTDDVGRADAFLVRLRRTPTTGPRSNALDREPLVSSAGPPIPLLFARGSLAQGPIIEDGVTVRATSIATARPAVRVHTWLAEDGAIRFLVPGLGPGLGPAAQGLPAFASDGLPTSSSFTVEIRPDGSVASTEASVTNLVAPPRFVGQSIAQVAVPTPVPTAVGVFRGALPTLLVASDPATGNRIVSGFVPVLFESDGAVVVVTILPADTIAPFGATAIDQRALTALAASPDLRAAFTAIPSRLLAPVLAR